LKAFLDDFGRRVYEYTGMAWEGADYLFGYLQDRARADGIEANLEDLRQWMAGRAPPAS